MVIVSVNFLKSYGAVLFFGTPVMTGAIASYYLNYPVRRTLGYTLWHSILTVTAACCVFLFVGIEGLICIAMAVPIMAPLGLCDA